MIYVKGKTFLLFLISHNFFSTANIKTHYLHCFRIESKDYLKVRFVRSVLSPLYKEINIG